MKKDIKKLAKELRKELQQNILNRYDNNEYFDPEMIGSFYQNNQLTEKEMEAINKILDI